MKPPKAWPDVIRQIRLLLLDVDGVLTDGSVIYTDHGVECKRFHVRDGAGIKLWQKSGRQVAILSGRTSPAVTRRAEELGISPVIQGQGEKLKAFQDLLAEVQLAPEQVVAMGDDLPDLPVLRRVGLAVSVADGCNEVRQVADYVTVTPGGQGAVREAIEWMLQQTGEWQSLVPGC